MWYTEPKNTAFVVFHRATPVDHTDKSNRYGYKLDDYLLIPKDKGCKYGGPKCLECKLPECIDKVQDEHPGRAKRVLLRRMKK